jgi:hypothetical protein
MNNYIKYPRTFHVPWTDGSTNDDKILSSMEHFKEKEVVVSVKMDGENTTMYNDHVHARSISSKNHVSRDWIKKFHSIIAKDIPDGWRICGENLYAKHSIHYLNLDTYFLAFSIWNEKNECLSWHDTFGYLDLLGICYPKVFFYGTYNENEIKLAWELFKKKEFHDYGQVHEGYVIRTVNSFKYDDFSKSVAKYVRKNHVQTDEHWMNSEVVPNILKENIK